MLLHRLYPKVELAEISFHHTEPLTRARELVAKTKPLT